MKRIIIICITAIICVSIFAVPLYYQVFFKAEPAPEPTTAVMATAGESNSKYMIVGNGEHAIIFNQETKEAFYISGVNVQKCKDGVIQ